MEAPPSYAPPPPAVKKAPKWPWILGSGCLLMVLMVAGAVFFGISVWKKDASEIEKVARKDAMAIGKDWSADSVRSRFDSEAYDKVSTELLDTWLTKFSEKLGHIDSVTSVRMVGAYSGTKGKSRRVRCDAQFDKAKGQIAITYVWESDEWKIHSFMVTSPALDVTPSGND